MKDINFVYTDDRVAVYVDGELKYKGSHIDELELLDILEIEYVNWNIAHDDLKEFGYTFPEKLEDLT